MIVQCASCQTRFKIGDDKVTERGVKVRCTKCGTVFVVRKGDGQSPGPATGIPTPAVVGPATVPPSSAPAAVAAAAAAVAAPAKPPPGRLPSRPPPPPPGLLDDLFGQLDLGQGSAARAPAPAPAAMPASPSPASVFGSAPAPAAATSSAATTGLEDLFGAAATPAAPARPPPPSAAAPSPQLAATPPSKNIVSALAGMPAPKPSDPFEAALAGTLDLALGPLGGGGSTSGSNGFSFDPTPSKAAAPSFGGVGAGFEDPLAGLDLDSPGPSAPHGPDPTNFLADENAGSEFDLGLGLGSDDTHLSPQTPAPPAEAAPPPPPPPPEPSTQAVTVRRVAPVSSAPPPPEDKSLFSLIFNGLGFVVVVVVIFLGFVAYRNGGKVDLHEPGKSLSSAFGHGGGAAGALDLPVLVTGSGYYPTLTDEPLMFASGRVTNASPTSQRVQIDLEVVDPAGQTLARGHGWPGRVPSPEDLFNVGNAADLDKLNQRLLQDQPPPLAPGSTEEFVVVVEKPAQGGQGYELRIRAAPFHPQAAADVAPTPGATKTTGPLTSAAAAGH